MLTSSRNPGSTRWGYFLRAETMHGFFSYLEDNPARSPEAVFHELSHGESFLELIRDRFTGAHSALLAALPGADILEIGGWGMRTATWSELDLVQNWRAFLGEPEAFLCDLVD